MQSVRIHTEWAIMYTSDSVELKSGNLMDLCWETVGSCQMREEDEGMCGLVSRQWEHKGRNVLGITC